MTSMGTVKIAILASGRGSNFQAILDSIKKGNCDAEVRVLITNNPDAQAIERAEANDIPVEIVERKQFGSREEMDDRIKELLDEYKAELVVLAGYMLLLKGKKLFESYKNRIINIHPALLPSFPGVDAQKQAFEHGVKVSGVTIHFVNEELDAGPIIYQEAVDISECKSADEAAERILGTEHKAYPLVVNMFAEGKFKMDGRRVIYKKD